MEQKLLHKMFNGEATDNELTQIRQWVNADKMNRETSIMNVPCSTHSN